MLTATIKKSNIDSHYNHKLNQYRNSLILKLNDMVYKHLDKESKKPHENNDIILSMDIIKIRVDDGMGIPIGEHGKSVWTNVRKIYASLGFKSSNKSLEPLDHDLYRDSIRLSLILTVKTQFESTPWRNGYVTTSLKEGAIW